MGKLGFEELRCARATFVCRVKGVLVAILVLHVDDGMLFGDPQDRRYQDVRKAIDRNFNIKFWKVLGENNPITYLGLQWTLQSGHFGHPHE